MNIAMIENQNPLFRFYTQFKVTSLIASCDKCTFVFNAAALPDDVIGPGGNEAVNKRSTIISSS